MIDIPFSRDSSVLTPTIDTVNRIRSYKRLIPGDSIRVPVLDIGRKNYVGSELKKHFALHQSGDWRWFQNTQPCDFNVEFLAPFQKYGTILCFEIVEHVMNPLLFLRNVAKLMEDDGILFLSTPIAPPFRWMMSTEHLTEYVPWRLKLLIERAGFRIEQAATFRTFPARILLFGFRPWIRYFFQGTQFYKLRKTQCSS
jgi:hypothetical protein